MRTWRSSRVIATPLSFHFFFLWNSLARAKDQITRAKRVQHLVEKSW
jgi:hypothetical protein